MVATPVGYRCPDCARGPKPAIYQAGTIGIARGVAVGLAVAVAVGVLWGLFPDWEFYWCVILGFGISESISWATKYKRGRELMTIAMSVRSRPRKLLGGGACFAYSHVTKHAALPTPEAIPSKK